MLCPFHRSAQGDISAGKMIFGVEGVDPARRAQLIQLLDIDLYQRVNTMSDGQRRRVQICMGLLKPYDVSLGGRCGPSAPLQRSTPLTLLPPPSSSATCVAGRQAGRQAGGRAGVAPLSAGQAGASGTDGVNPCAHPLMMLRASLSLSLSVCASGAAAGRDHGGP